jgi:hypothetical protein
MRRLRLEEVVWEPNALGKGDRFPVPLHGGEWEGCSGPLVAQCRDSREALLSALRSSGVSAGGALTTESCEVLRQACLDHLKAVVPLAAEEARASAAGVDPEQAPPPLVWVPILVSAEAARPKAPDTPWTVSSWAFDAAMTTLMLGFVLRECGWSNIHRFEASTVLAPLGERADWAGIYHLMQRPPVSDGADALVEASKCLRRAACVFHFAADKIGPLLIDSLAPRTAKGWKSAKVPPDCVPACQRALAQLCLAEVAVCSCVFAQTSRKAPGAMARLWKGAESQYQEMLRLVRDMSAGERHTIKPSLLSRCSVMAGHCDVQTLICQCAVGEFPDAPLAVHASTGVLLQLLLVRTPRLSLLCTRPSRRGPQRCWRLLTRA